MALGRIWRRLAVLAAVVVGFGVPTLWVLYYASEWRNRGQGVWMPFFLLILAAWALLGGILVNWIHSSRRVGSGGDHAIPPRRVEPTRTAGLKRGYD